MTFPRHASRHVQATVLGIVSAQLDTLGWTDAETLPFGTNYASVVRFGDFPAIAGDRLAEGVDAGLVTCTLGPEFPPLEEELGGPTSRADYPLFFDLFQGSYATATALANDIRDTLLGRFSGTKRHISIINQVTDEAITGWTCELTDVEITRPEIRLPLHWQVVKVTAQVYFPEEQY